VRGYGGSIVLALRSSRVPRRSRAAGLTRGGRPGMPDKVVTKRILASAGLPTLPHVVIANRAIARWTAGPALLDAIRALGGSFVIKPVHGSGGMGVKLTTRSEDVSRAYSLRSTTIRSHRQPYTRGHEFTVVVVGPPDQAVCFGTAELTSTAAVTRLAAACGDRSYRPATPPKPLETLATKAYRAMGCRDVALVDFIVDDRRQPWILEVDTSPDLYTRRSGLVRGCVRRPENHRLAHVKTTVVFSGNRAPGSPRPSISRYACPSAAV
jgi:hypothetical protein